MSLERAALAFVGVAVALRTLWVLLGLARTLLRPKIRAAVEWDWTFWLISPEPLLLPGTAWWLAAQAAERTVPVAAASGAALLAAAGLALSLWSFLSMPTMAVGHYQLADQPLVERGPYRFVRHPIYAGALLLWSALTVGTASVAVLLVVLLYVIPAYLCYIHGEERMVLRRYGDAYREYRRRVGMLVPRLFR